MTWPSGSVRLTAAVSEPLSAKETYDFRLGSRDDSSWRVSSTDDATESRKAWGMRPRTWTLASWFVASQLSAMVGIGGASWMLEAKLKLLATLRRLLTLLRRADLRIDSLAVRSISSLGWSGK